MLFLGFMLTVLIAAIAIYVINKQMYRDYLREREKMYEDIRRDKGFTLIEVVVVLLIIAMLLAIVVPQVVRAYNKAQTEKLESAEEKFQAWTKTKPSESSGQAFNDWALDGLEKAVESDLERALRKDDHNYDDTNEIKTIIARYGQQAEDDSTSTYTKPVPVVGVDTRLWTLRLTGQSAEYDFSHLVFSSELEALGYKDVTNWMAKGYSYNIPRNKWEIDSNGVLTVTGANNNKRIMLHCDWALVEK